MAARVTPSGPTPHKVKLGYSYISGGRFDWGHTRMDTSEQQAESSMRHGCNNNHNRMTKTLKTTQWNCREMRGKQIFNKTCSIWSSSMSSSDVSVLLLCCINLQSFCINVRQNVFKVFQFQSEMIFLFKFNVIVFFCSCQLKKKCFCLSERKCTYLVYALCIFASFRACGTEFWVYQRLSPSSCCHDIKELVEGTFCNCFESANLFKELYMCA